MTYGFIGLGNMASAIIGGMRSREEFRAARIFGFDTDAEKRALHEKKNGIAALASAEEVVRAADTVILAVKPQVLPTVLPALAPLAKGKLFISIAAGKDLAFYASFLGNDTPVVRVMPNINATVGAAASAITANAAAGESGLSVTEGIFRTVGSVFRLDERLFSAFVGISGSSVAFAYLYIEYIARAGEAAGIPYDLALAISTEAAAGSAKMVRESGIAPETLAKMVCSPGGTTIEGVQSLGRDDYRGTILRAVDAVVKKDEYLKKQK